MISSQTREILALVGDIRDGRLLLPELQRRYVWKAPQVKNLFDSLYHQYPSGQLLVWETNDLPFSRATSLAGVAMGERRPQLLLDGQQRLTSLAAVMLGQPLQVRGSKRPIDIVFNVHTEKFEVAGPRQSGEAGWISLSKFFTRGLVAVLRELHLDPSALEADEILERLNKLDRIKHYRYQVSVLEDLTYDEVTHIFVRINSGGTKLASTDLALAQVSSRWRGVTVQFADYQNAVWKRGHKLWIESGYLLRVLTAILTRQSRPSLLFRGERQKLTVDELEGAWNRTKTALDQAIDFLAYNCHIDRFDFLPTHYILVPLAAYFDRFGAHVGPRAARDLQRWVYMALIWTRYSSSAETAVDQDVAALEKEDPIALMIQYIEDKAGRRPVTERELRDQRKNSPFMLMTYVLARRAEAQDWFNGVAIGSSQTLELHHIFPKRVLRDDYDLRAASRTVDQVANLAFLSKRANTKITSRTPAEYLPEIDVQRLKAQLVPTDPALWSLDRFEDFLHERRTLIANAINRLLQSLSDTPSLWPVSDRDLLETRTAFIEKQMRALIEERLEESRGAQAWDMAPAETRNTVRVRAQQRTQSTPFNAEHYGTLEGKLELCQFSDLQRIVKANWALFEELFGNADRLNQHYQAVTDARNAFAHNRELSPSEMASAEAGLLWLEDCLRAWTPRIDEEELESPEAESEDETELEEEDES